MSIDLLVDQHFFIFYKVNTMIDTSTHWLIKPDLRKELNLDEAALKLPYVDAFCAEYRSTDTHYGVFTAKAGFMQVVRDMRTAQDWLDELDHKAFFKGLGMVYDESLMVHSKGSHKPVPDRVYGVKCAIEILKAYAERSQPLNETVVDLSAVIVGLAANEILSTDSISSDFSAFDELFYWRVVVNRREQFRTLARKIFDEKKKMKTRHAPLEVLQICCDILYNTDDRDPDLYKAISILRNEPKHFMTLATRASHARDVQAIIDEYHLEIPKKETT